MIITNILLLINFIILLCILILYTYIFFYNLSCKNRIIVSLTTSPKRIHNLKTTIDSILNQNVNVDFIIINLPKVFKRDGSKFKEIPDFLLNNGKIIINNVEDIGPSTKIVPTCKSSFTTEDDIIFSIDDDIYYPPDTIKTYLFYHSLYPNCVITGTSLFYLEGNRYYPLKQCELLEGFSCVLYKKSFVNDIEDWNFDRKFVPTSYYLADDLLLSNHICKKKIKILALTPNSSIFKNIKPLEYGLKDDALHKGAGGVADTCTNQQHCNLTNYIEAIKWLKSKNLYYLQTNETSLLGHLK